ncbi:MAG: serine/threonine-protein kinase [Gemmatimonadales bacterium]
MTSIQDRLQAHLADHFVIERELGRGGMATVYLATDLDQDRKVAIKVLHPDLSVTISADRFEREIKLAAQLQHPGILGLFQSGDAGGLLYYVMPFVEGESLRDRLDREGQLPLEDALGIVREVADALGFAHQQGVVHRDIKPENVLLSGGRAIVADFGIASAVTEGGGEKLTQTGMAVGTPMYMAPEQAAGEKVGPASDLYSLGCVLYETLAGDPPFSARNAHGLMARHAMEAVPSIRIVRDTVPEEVEDAIFAAMAKTPADRPQTAAEFAELLGAPLGATASRRASIRATATRRVPTQAAITARRPRPWWQRPVALGTAAAVLAASAAFTAWRLAGASPRTVGSADPTTRRVAVLYFEDRSEGRPLQPVADGLTEALIRRLTEVRELSVVSRNGVGPYRGSDVPADSIARALGAGTVIVGTVEAVGTDRVRITTRLLDHGNETGRRDQLELPQSQLLAAEDSVAVVVSNTLREWIGDEVRLREGQARTSSLAAWSLANRAETEFKDAEQLARRDPAAAADLLARADSLFAEAAAEDRQWVDPVVQRGEAAYLHARLVADPGERARWLETAREASREALARDPRSAAALGLRGVVAFAEWNMGSTVDPVARAALLDSARGSLEQATRLDPTLASAFAQLSFVYYADKSVPVSYALDASRKAYEADAFLSYADLILNRLFWSSYDTNLFADAARWCDEGRRRFPADPRFTECQLWLLLPPNVAPDVALAWQIKARVDSLTPPADRPVASRLSQLIVGGVIGRLAKGTGSPGAPDRALADSADRVLRAARADLQLDPHQELLGYEAIMRAQSGDLDEATELLRRYVSVNPDHSFKVGDNVHWWWEGLQGRPEFQALLARR